MDAFKSFAFLKRIPLLGFLGVFILLIFSGLGIAFQVPMKIIVIGWTAFLAMSVAAAIGIRVGDHHPKGLVWSYGLASGAMVTSAAIFLIPPAINHHPTAGSIGIAGGLITGFSGLTIGDRLTHYNLPLDRTIAELTAHAITTGTIIGIIYISLPVLGPLLGLAVISHKAPAGYVAARRLQQANISTGIIGLPASVVGIFAIGTNLLPLTISPLLSAGIF
ncbi:MAG: ZIP family metal transporter, partial [Halobacteriaceae archaeon]